MNASLRNILMRVLGEHNFYEVGYYYLLTNKPFRESLKRLRQYQNRHSGNRCFIIGNGPSLQKTNLSLLRKEYTFGLNRIYLMYGDLGFQPTYYVVVNKLVVEQCSEDIIKQVKSPKFISYDARRWLQYTPDIIYLCSRDGPHFYTNLEKGVWQGGTVTNVALQIAYYMGFQQVILVGVDHSYSAVGKPNEMVVSNGSDPNHFDPRYFGKGFRWNLPDLEVSEQGYKLAKKAFESDGREVLDATIDGKLNIFRKVDYSSLF